MSVQVKYCISLRLAALEDDDETPNKVGRPSLASELERCFPELINELPAKRIAAVDHDDPKNVFLLSCGSSTVDIVNKYREALDALLITFGASAKPGQIKRSRASGASILRMVTMTRTSFPPAFGKRRREYHFCAMAAAFESIYTPIYRQDALTGVMGRVRNAIFDVVHPLLVSNPSVDSTSFWPDLLTASLTPTIRFGGTKALIRRQTALEQEVLDNQEIKRVLRAISKSPVARRNPGDSTLKMGEDVSRLYKEIEEV